MGKNVDTGTFTRPKRTRPQVNDMPPDHAKLPEESDSTDSKNHPNVSDIENLAKLQEESKSALTLQILFESKLIL